MANKKTNRREKGGTFYEVQPIAAARSNINYKRIERASILATTAFMEVVVLWTAVVVDGLLLLRMIVTFVGISSENLLGFLIYALSYPLVAIFPFTAGRVNQVPAVITKFEGDTFLAFFIYLILAYMIVHLIHIFQKSDLAK